ncbi:MAG: DUF2141 domain-containing protein [Flavobacteriaceae bacterium]
MTIALMFTVVFAQARDEHTITVHVENIKNNAGKINVGLYGSKSTWLNKIVKGARGEISDTGTSSVVLENVAPGTYGISLYHDENDNDELDMRFGMFPKEAYGCSNQATGMFGPPKWEDAKFTVKGDKTITIKL